MTDRRDRLALAAILVVGVTLRLGAWPCAPDIYDGVGYVEAVTDFDLAAFRPHAPGAPLLVGLSRLVHLFGITPLASVVLVNLALGVGAVFAAHSLVRGAFGGRIAPLFAAAWVAVAPGLVVASAATLSDGAAVALGTMAYACAFGDGRLAALYAGVLGAAAVGVRPADVLWIAPVPVVFLARHRRRETVECAGVGVLASLAWIAPASLVIGAQRWWALSRAQLDGHVARWGETDPIWAGSRGRLIELADAVSLQIFGVEGTRYAIVLLVSLGAILVLAALGKLQRGVLLLALLALPGVLLIACAQPVAAAPRHALPLAVVVIALLSAALASAEKRHLRGPTIVAAVFLSSIAWMGLEAATEHRRPPPAVAMLRFVAHDASLTDAVVIGSRSARFAAWGERARIAPGSLAGDAVIYAMKADVLPRPLLVTSDLDLRGVPPDRLRLVGTWTRGSPLDRRERTLSLYVFDLRIPQ